MIPLDKEQQEIQALKRELITVSFMGIPGPILAMVGGMSLIGGEEILLHPALANTALTTSMLLVGIAWVIWEVCRVVPIQMKLRALRTTGLKSRSPDRQ